MILVNLILRILLLSLAMTAAALCLHLDVNIIKNGLSEYSVTEIMQESILFIIVLIHLLRFSKNRDMRRCNALISGFFIAMFIRELDAVFDLVHHGSWVWFALLVSCITIIYAFRQPQETIKELVTYSESPSFGMMISGLLAILIFSRIFGMSTLWQSILQDGYAREVKNMVEEGVELFGYVLCLGSSLNILRSCRAS